MSPNGQEGEWPDYNGLYAAGCTCVEQLPNYEGLVEAGYYALGFTARYVPKDGTGVWHDAGMKSRPQNPDPSCPPPRVTAVRIGTGPGVTSGTRSTFSGGYAVRSSHQCRLTPPRGTFSSRGRRSETLGKSRRTWSWRRGTEPIADGAERKPILRSTTGYQAPGTISPISSSSAVLAIAKRERRPKIKRFDGLRRLSRAALR